jgi:hypothetical protein
VSQVQVAERGVLTTVIPCISANGDLIPPFIIVKGQRLSPDFIESVPKTYGIASTKSAYIDRYTFVKFLSHFKKNRQKLNINGTAYLVLGGHSSHLSYEAIDFCLKGDI